MEKQKNVSYKAFEQFYNSYFDLIYEYVFGMIRSHNQTKEIVQDTFIKVWLHRSKIEAEPSFKSMVI